MKKLNNKGFTLVELIATVVLLSLVISLGAVSITAVIKNSKEKNYELLIKEIKDAVEEQYIECQFSNNSAIEDACPSKQADGYYHIQLQDLVDNGFLKGNSTIKSNDVDQNGKFILVNPNDDKKISECKIRYKYENGNIFVLAVNPNGSCPTSY